MGEYMQNWEKIKEIDNLASEIVLVQEMHYIT